MRGWGPGLREPGQSGVGWGISNADAEWEREENTADARDSIVTHYCYAVIEFRGVMRGVHCRVRMEEGYRGSSARGDKNNRTQRQSRDPGRKRRERGRRLNLLGRRLVVVPRLGDTLHVRDVEVLSNELLAVLARRDRRRVLVEKVDLLER